MRSYEGIYRNDMKETMCFITHETLSRVVFRLCLTAFSNNCGLSHEGRDFSKLLILNPLPFWERESDRRSQGEGDTRWRDLRSRERFA